jgi:hypothetical protein
VWVLFVDCPTWGHSQTGYRVWGHAVSTDLRRYLGIGIADLLRAQPFASWRAVRSVERDPRTEIRYDFPGHGVEVICDEADCVRTIFLHRGGGECLVDIPFRIGRAQVLSRMGGPAKSGQPVCLPGIGKRGAWDRFTLEDCLIHVQYCLGRDEVDMVTIMRKDAVQ